MNFLREVCVDKIDDAIKASKLGADRIEFCSKLDEDGLTPKIEELLLIKKLVDIPIRVMVRPHSKSFVYNNKDIEKMKNTIDLCKENNFDGVVFGCLKSNNELDLSLISELANYSKPLNVIIHKAIDLTNSPLESLKNLIGLSNIDGVLTSGGYQTAQLGIPILKQMINICPKGFEIISAGKITNENIIFLHDKIHGQYYHGKKIVGEL